MSHAAEKFTVASLIAVLAFAAMSGFKTSGSEQIGAVVQFVLRLV